MTRNTLWSIAAVLGVFLSALLLYSFDRTATAYAMFEGGTEYVGYLGLSGKVLGGLAAAVVEFALVGLLIGKALASLMPPKNETREVIERWGVWGMAGAVSVQALINLIAGGVRGWNNAYQELVAAGADARVAAVVSGLAWLVINGLVPLLIYALSEIIAKVVKLALQASPHRATVNGLLAQVNELRAAVNEARTYAEQQQALGEQSAREAEHLRSALAGMQAQVAAEVNEQLVVIEQRYAEIEQQRVAAEQRARDAERQVNELQSSLNELAGGDELNKTELAHRLNSEYNLTYDKIAALFNVSKTTVSNWLKPYRKETAVEREA